MWGDNGLVELDVGFEGWFLRLIFEVGFDVIGECNCFFLEDVDDVNLLVRICY